jgi:type II secretory ATPase GspE/PulE/Tfp pilus assembly ATPase PilB-like protein
MPKTQNEIDETIAGFEIPPSKLEMLIPDYRERLEKAEDKKSLDRELCVAGFISEAVLLGAYAEMSALPTLEEKELGDLEAIRALPKDFISYWNCAPYALDDGKIFLAVGNPYHLDEISHVISELTGKDVEFKLARASWIDAAIQAAFSEEDHSEDGNMEMESEQDLLSLASEAKIVRLVNDMFSLAVEDGASDIHIEPGESHLAVRFRVDGKLYESMSPPPSLYPAMISRIKLLGGMNIAERRLPQDGRSDMRVAGTSIDVRISTVPTIHGESVVCRILRKDTLDFNLKALGMEKKLTESFENLYAKPHGMILVVGPTGSGKSTTLHSVISKINTLERKIITIEDPVEYRVDGVQQIQVNPKIGLDFASGLRHIVRQDPDVILVGEIRDKETAEIAIHAALTGHLVLSTLHTNDAPSALTRLVDMGIDAFLVSSAVIGVLSQRLVRKLCPVCGGPDSDRLGSCEACSGRGFTGRMGIFELMAVDDDIRSLVNDGADADAIAETAEKAGMEPLLENGKRKVEAGLTTMAEVAGVSFDADV